jgi:hypothetical protein
VRPRVELKYALDEDAAARVRRFVAPFVAEDPAVPSAGGQRVTSLYLDTPRGDFCGRHLARDADRFKLRVRRYGEDEPQVVYFEVKRKVGRVTDKRRARVAAASAPRLLAAGGAAADAVATPDGESLRLFLWLMALHRAAPRMLVTCRRESFVGPEPGCEARVTFDHDTSFQPVLAATLRGDPGRWSRTPLEDGSVLLELKYSGAPPWWMAELARRLGRRRTAYSKYVAAVAVAGAARLAPYADLEARA